jgi:hypothetical protein
MSFGPFCERLGTPFVMDLGSEGLLSPEAVANPPVFARARAVAHFEDGPVRQLVHRLKYSDRMELAKPLGAWMARAGNELLVEADLLVPVPLHRRRLAGRRFNQANFPCTCDFGPMRRPGRSFCPRAGQADAVPGRAFAFAAGAQYAWSVSGGRRDESKGRRPRDCPYRRCHDLGVNRQCRLARAVAWRRPARRCLGFRPGAIGLDHMRRCEIGSCCAVFVDELDFD